MVTVLLSVFLTLSAYADSAIYDAGFSRSCSLDSVGYEAREGVESDAKGWYMMGCIGGSLICSSKELTDYDVLRLWCYKGYLNFIILPSLHSVRAVQVELYNGTEVQPSGTAVQAVCTGAVLGFPQSLPMLRRLWYRVQVFLI